jgi:hypothetical protein
VTLAGKLSRRRSPAGNSRRRTGSSCRRCSLCHRCCTNSKRKCCTRRRAVGSRCSPAFGSRCRRCLHCLRPSPRRRRSHPCPSPAARGTYPSTRTRCHRSGVSRLDCTRCNRTCSSRPTRTKAASSSCRCTVIEAGHPTSRCRCRQRRAVPRATRGPTREQGGASCAESTATRPRCHLHAASVGSQRVTRSR